MVLYMKYIKYMGYLFATIMLVNLPVLLPYYSALASGNKGF